jgi:integrase
MTRFRDWENVQKPEFGNYKLIFRILNDLFGDLEIGSLRGPQVKELLAAFVKAGWSRGYSNNQLRRFKRFIKWCVSDDLCSADVLATVRTVEGLQSGDARETAPVRPVSAETFAATLPYLPPVVADLLRIIGLTGARPGEIRRLKIGNIDRTETVWTAKLVNHKNAHRGQSRTLLFGPRAQAILTPYLSRDADEAVFSPRLSESLRHAEQRAKRKTKVQPSQRNRRAAKPKRPPGAIYTKDGLNRAVVRACELAFGMPIELRRISRTLPAATRDKLRKQAADWRAANCWSPNMLRHTRGTEIRKLFGLESTQAVLGHANLSTSEIYAEKNLARAAEIMREIG